MDLNRLDKINLEKRRRHQVYTTIDYVTSCITYFDFFSSDAFEIAENAKYLAELSNKKIVNTEFLLLAFFYSDVELRNIMQDFKITEKRIARLIMKNSKLEKLEKGTFSTLFSKLKLSKKVLSTKLEYSYEVNKLFEKAAENAMTRFKTPVINSSILFITLLEDKNSLAQKMLKHMIKNEIDWYLIRYQILKALHSHESTIRSNVKINQHFFAYLLKTQLSDKEFSSLIEKETLSESVSLFRNDLVHQSLKLNLIELLNRDISLSMKVFNKRRYTL